MLFHVSWDYSDPTEERQKRSLGLFANWTPGPAQFQGFYGYADGGGGMAIMEAESAADLAKTLAPWTPYLKFTARVIMPIEESSAIIGEAIAWRESQ